MRLSIVTLNYKKPDLTLACMASLHEQFSKEFQNDEVEMIVVDNDSGDTSVEVIREVIKKNSYKNTHLIANKENAGFGKGCNIGADVATGDYILFFNNDSLVKDNSIMAMVDYMDNNKQAAILGGQLRNEDGSLQASSGTFYTLLNALSLLLGLQKFGLLDRSPEKISPVDWVKGSLLMIRKKVFEELSGFDEKIFMYTEDMELCYRAKLAGYDTMFYPKINVIHAEHGSANRSFAIIHIYKGLLYFYKKHKSYGEYMILKWLLLTKAVVAIIIGSLFGKPDLVSTYKKAINF